MVSHLARSLASPLAYFFRKRVKKCRTTKQSLSPHTHTSILRPSSGILDFTLPLSRKLQSCNTISKLMSASPRHFLRSGESHFMQYCYVMTCRFVSRVVMRNILTLFRFPLEKGQIVSWFCRLSMVDASSFRTSPVGNFVSNRLFLPARAGTHKSNM